MGTLTDSAVARYGGAIVAIVLSTIIRLALDPLLGDQFPVATHLLAILVVAGYSGRGPAVLATALGFLTAAYFLISPRHQFRIDNPQNQYGLLLYLIVGTGIATLGGALRRMKQKAESEAAEAVQERERWRITLASVGDAVIVTDAEGRITSLNPAAEMLTGWSTAEGVGQPLPEVFRILNETTRTPVDNPTLRALREGTIVGLANHTLLIARDGSERPIDDSAAPIRDSAGGIVGAVLVFHDITERRRDEDALKQADRRKDEFLATLAHELRNPLAPIRTGLQILRLAGDDRVTAEEALTRMERQISHMVRLIDDLMDISRINSDKLVLRRETVELVAIVKNALETSRPLLQAAGHRLTVTLPDRPLHVNADLTRLSQVFSNLLNNAAKYTERGGDISLSVETQGNEVAVAVRDNGVGIPAEMLPNIFTMFTQIDRTLDRAQGGLGIGLSLVRRLIELHGGSVEGHSGGHGLGSEFIVRLPLVLPPPTHPETREREAKSAASSVAGLRILVVDDNKDAVSTLACLLEIQGHEIRVACDGGEAVATAERFEPEVILLDLGLPVMSGYEVARSIRACPWGRGIVIIALTGWGQDDDRRRTKEAGFDHHLVKPADALVLNQLLSDVQTSSTR